MLKILRQKGLKKKIFWGIILIMVIAFVFWGVGAYTQSSKTNTYEGEIFGRKISTSEFNQLYVYYMHQLQLNFGDKYQEFLPYFNLRGQTFNQLTLVEQAKKLHIRSSDNEVVQAIASNPLFLKDGKFNQDNYERIIRFYYNNSPRDFEEIIREELTVKKLRGHLTKDITVNEEQIRVSYKNDQETLSINYIQTIDKDFIAQIQPMDNEIKEYYDKNSQDFKRPPTTRIEYLKEEFPEKASEFDRLRIFEHVRTFYPQLQSASSLKDITVEKIAYHQSGPFSAQEPIDGILSNDFYKYAFSLKEKETSPLIQAADAVYVLRVIEKKDSYIPNIDEAKDQISQTLKTKKAKELAKAKIDEYKTKISESLKTTPSLNFKDIVKLLGLEAKTSKEFKRGDSIPDIGYEKNLSEAAFSLKSGQISEVIEGNSGYYIITQEKFTGIDEEKYKQEKETYKNKLLEQKKDEAFNLLGQEIITKANLKDYSPSTN